MDLTAIPATVLSFALPFLIAIVIIVFVHEYGHFQVARWCGVKVDVFSIGFGREIFGWNDKQGTRWKICWLPLGGYVKFEGDANAASMPGAPAENVPRSPGNFHGKPVWQRAAVVAAGPIANFILAIFIFFLAFTVLGEQYSEPRIDAVIAGSPASEAGLKPGDYVRKVNGAEIKSFEDLQQATVMRGGEELTLVIERAGGLMELKLTPRVMDGPDALGRNIKVARLGVQHEAKNDKPQFETYSPPQAFVRAVEQTWSIVALTGRYVKKLLIGQESLNQIGGPATMAQGAAATASYGIWAFVSFVALLSVSIGLINLFPVPMLDGGHLVFYVIEAIRGKPLGEGAQEWSFRIGFSFVVMLMLVGIWNDIVRAVT